MRISDWSSDVCSSDLLAEEHETLRSLTKNNPEGSESFIATADDMEAALNGDVDVGDRFSIVIPTKVERNEQSGAIPNWIPQTGREIVVAHGLDPLQAARALKRSEEHTSELQSLMRISYAVFCLKKNKQ